MEFPWRCNVDTIAMDLKVSWEMSARGVQRPHAMSIKTILVPVPNLIQVRSAATARTAGT